jgi:hypothetical protein
MHTLKINLRPTVEFNPANKAHRELYAQYKRDQSWGKIPVRFTVGGTYGITLGHIETRLIEYYIEKEFKNQAEINTV